MGDGADDIAGAKALSGAGRAAGAVGLALLLATAAALWASEGARVFLDAAFSAALACL